MEKKPIQAMIRLIALIKSTPFFDLAFTNSRFIPINIKLKAAAGTIRSVFTLPENKILSIWKSKPGKRERKFNNPINEIKAARKNPAYFFDVESRERVRIKKVMDDKIKVIAATGFIAFEPGSRRLKKSILNSHPDNASKAIKTTEITRYFDHRFNLLFKFILGVDNIKKIIGLF